MPVAASPSTSKRLLALLSLLQSRRDWPAATLAARLEVSERTVRRDIDRLRELDYAIGATRGPDGGYRREAGAQLPPLLFDDEQVVALVLALRTASSLGAGVEEAAERALFAVRRLMPARLATRVAHLADTVSAQPQNRAAQADPAVLVRIGEAIRAAVELRFDYASPDPDRAASAPPVRTIQPHHLLLHAGRWYLLGYSPGRDDWRVYRADRIRPRTHDGRSFDPRPVPGGDPARYLAARFKGSASADVWPCEGEATLDAPLAQIAPYVGDGTVEVLEDDRCRVRLGSWSWDALAATMCRFPHRISAVEPAELRTAFEALAMRAATVGQG